MQYLSALLLHIQKRLEGGRGPVVSIKARAVCGEDRRCLRAVNSLMMSLVEKGLAKYYKRGVYLIERSAGEEVLKALKEAQQLPRRGGPQRRCVSAGRRVLQPPC